MKRIHPLVYVGADASQLLEDYGPRLTRLQAEGFTVCVAAPWSPALEEFASRGLEIRPLPGADRWNILGRLGSYPILQAQFLEQRPALVHGFGEPWAWIAAYAAHTAGVPAVLATIEGHTFDRLHSRAYRKLAQWVHGYVVHHEADLEGLLSRAITSKAQTELLLGGRGIEMAAFDPDREDLKPSRRPVARIVIAVRRSREVAALQKQVARRHPAVGWLELDGPARPAELAAADLFVGLDADDDVGGDLMAAAAMRVPVVAVESLAARSVIVDFETGRIARGDVLAPLAELIGDPKRSADMGIRARARAEQRFDRVQIDEQLLRIYDRLLTGKIT